jgi:hypothetical protein
MGTKREAFAWFPPCYMNLEPSRSLVGDPLLQLAVVRDADLELTPHALHHVLHNVRPGELSAIGGKQVRLAGRRVYDLILHRRIGAIRAHP